MVAHLSPLRIKLLRDLRRLWAQVLAIALVMAAGVATLILGAGAYDSLAGTRAAYYETNRFADVFAQVTRAPRDLGAAIAAIDGVLAVDLRIVRSAILDIDGMSEPGTVRLVSLPATGGQRLNLLHLRAGRLPDPHSTSEVAVSEGFATAHRLQPGASFRVLMNGQKRSVTVTGIALSPEFIYALGPGDMMPDARRFGIVWMPEAALAAAYDLDGAFSDVALKLVPGTSEPRAIAALDRLLARYGGTGATGRKDQMSHAFLDAELKQLRAMSRILPPIFLLVAAFLVNMTLARLVALEREQIGLLKAIGYGPGAIARHYIEFVLLIAVIGIAIGFGAGTWLGAGMARLYARFFNFPFLIFSRDPAIYALAALVTGAAAVAGAANAVRAVAWLPPAVAMAPPAPLRYRRLMGDGAGRLHMMRQSGVMVARHLLRWPLRTGAGILGIAFAVAILVGSMWSFGSVDRMIDITYYRTDRQDATLSFATERPMAALAAARAMPGVLRAEPFRSVAVRLGNGSVSRRLMLTGIRPEAALTRILDEAEAPMRLPRQGLVLSGALAGILGVTAGDTVRLERLDGDRREVTAQVSGISLGYLGLSVFADLGEVSRLMGDGDLISGAQLALDPARQAEFHAAVKATPQAGGLMLKLQSLRKFRDTLAENLLLMITVYTAFAGIIAFGVVYNFARISLSEQGRELASLRVLGFTRSEVAAILFTEIAIVVALAQPLGWLIGYGFALAMAQSLSSELYRVPMVLGREVLAQATLVVIAAALLSSALVRGRINRLDMIEVLKTRE